MEEHCNQFNTFNCGAKRARSTVGKITTKQTNNRLPLGTSILFLWKTGRKLNTVFSSIPSLMLLPSVSQNSSSSHHKELFFDKDDEDVLQESLQRISLLHHSSRFHQKDVSRVQNVYI